MRGIKILITVFNFMLVYTGSAQEVHYKKINGQLVLTLEGASHFAKLPLKCAGKEWPYKTGITFSDSTLVKSPKNYHPAFYGCFDWHSSVHGHWMLVRLLKIFPEIAEAAAIRSLLNSHFTKENIEQEIKIFQLKDNKSFERTYGWAWLLQLQNELLNWGDTDAVKWAAALQPLATELSLLTRDYLNKIIYPIRVGEHSNLAFGLSMMYDYTIHQNDTALKRSINNAAIRFYANDTNCPFSWEPGGNDFLSPCLEEADLMRKVLPKKAFIVWLKKFMPQLFDKHLKIETGKVKDRSDGKLVHLDGLNLSRAWCLKGIAATLNNQHLLDLANEHLMAALPQVATGNYEGEHWLASFAIYALTN